MASFLDIFLGRTSPDAEWGKVEKSLLDAESIEKSKKGVRRAQHKYIRVFTGIDGKDRYLYPEDLLVPFTVLINAFGMVKSKIIESYEKNNIERSYGIDKDGYARHILEYLTNRVKWDNLFKSRAERDKNKKPVAQKVVEDNAKKQKEEKGKTVKEAAEKNNEKNVNVINRSLMRKIYSMYNKVPEDAAEPEKVISEVKPAAEKIKEFVGRKTMKKPDGTTVMMWNDGRIIHTDKKGNVVYDNAATDQKEPESVVETATTEETVSSVDDVKNENVKVSVQIKTKKVYDKQYPSTLTEYELLFINGEQVACHKQYEAGYYEMSEHDRNVLSTISDADGIKEETVVHKDLKGTKEEIKKQIENIGYDDEKTERDFLICVDNIEDIESPEEEHQNRSEAMMGNQNAKNNFVDFVDNFVSNGYKSDKIVNLLDSTPSILKEHGIPDNPISITPNILEKILTDESNIYHGHNIAIEIVKDLPNQLENPVYILKGKENKKIIVTEHHIEDRPIIAVLEIDRNQGRTKVNSLRSLYDKKNEIFNEWINNPNLVEYENTEKSKVLLQSIDNQYAKEVTTPYGSNDTTNSDNVNGDIKNNTIEDFINTDFGKVPSSTNANEYLEFGKNHIADVINLDARKYGGLTRDEYDKKLMEYQKIKNESGIHSPENIKKMIDFSKIFIETCQEELNTASNDTQKASLTNMIIETTNNIKMLNDWFDLDKSDPKFFNKEWKEYLAKHPEEFKNTNTLSDAMKNNKNAAGKHNVKPKTEKENKEEKKKENESRKKAGMNVPNEEMGERSSAIEDVDYQNNEFTETEETVKEKIKKEVRAPENQAQKDAFNELAKASYELAKKSYGASFYGRMNHKLSATEDEVSEAKKRYDDAVEKYNKLIGSDNADFSYNPNAENYAYRDTGYIAGSQKEKIAQFWADVESRGMGVKVEDIDWNALEENSRYAETKIVKANILKKPDFESLRDYGMSGGAAYFYNRLIDCIPVKPYENTPECHRNYVLAINTFQERMEKCKTVDDIANEMVDIANEMKGVFVGVEQLPEIIELKTRISLLEDRRKKEEKEFTDAEIELWKIPEIKQWVKDHNNDIKRMYGKPYPFNFYKESDEDSKLSGNFVSFWVDNDKYYEFIKQNEDVLNKYESFRKYKAILDTADIVDTGRYGMNRRVLLPTDKKSDELKKQIRLIVRDKTEEYSKNSSERKMWESFGLPIVGTKVKNRFYEYMSSADGFSSYFYRGNKTILGHYENAKKGKFDDWEWVPKKEENSVSGEKKERKESFQLLVATEHERKGGKDVSVKTTQELKEMFNLRDIQSGEWVLSDPKSAKWHVDRCCEGFSDLCDITGIPENLVSLNGRLALAIGARGHKGALAHYEPVERVINITKMHGGGSLAHEWFHSFDNLLSESMLGGNIDAWLTKPGERGMKNAPDTVIPEVKQAFTKLVDAMMKGDVPIFKESRVTDTDIKNADKTIRNVLYYRNYNANSRDLMNAVMNANSFDEANNLIISNFKRLVYIRSDGTVRDKDVVNFQKCQKAIAAKFGKDTVNVFTGETRSHFYAESFKLDRNGKSRYWSTTHEMAARAFSGFIGDNLRNAGRVNTYLTSHDTNDSYVLYGVKPNPEGEERERINAAFKELFDVIKSTNAIQKSIDFEEFCKIIKNNDFILNGSKFLIRKSILEETKKDVTWGDIQREFIESVEN